MLAAAVTVAAGAAVALAPAAQARPAAAAAAAAGGSLVYVKGGAIHVARATGTHDRVFAKGQWTWPSMDNHGVIAALGPDGKTSPDGSTGYSIYRISRSGRKLGRTPTPADYSTFSCPNYPPNHLSISPDGKKVAFDYTDCNGIFATWMPVSPRLHLHTFGDYYAPAWRSADQMVISHFGTTVTDTQATIGLWVPGGHPTGWTAGMADSWATSYHAVSSRDGTKIVLIEDDAANYFTGEPKHVRLVFGTAAGPGKPITTRCSVSLPANLDAGNWYGTNGVGMSFRPDGNAVAWDARNGIWTANTSRLGSCSASSVHAHLWIRGGADPSFSPARA